MDSTASELLANHFVGLAVGDIPPRLVEDAKTLVLDYLGVGIAGSQTDSGSWADLPAAPIRSRIPRAVMIPAGISKPMPFSSLIEVVLNSWNIQTMAMPKAVSPMRVTMKALRPAVAFFYSLYQNPIRA